MPRDLTGIRRDRYGWRVYVRVRPHEAVKRFPPDTSRRTLIEARDALRTILRARRDTSGPPLPAPTTLRDDAARYLARFPVVSRGRRWLVETWVAVLGERVRSELRAADLQSVLDGWTQFSPSTLRKLRGELRHLYHVLDGRSAVNPVRDTTVPAIPEPGPRAIPLGHVRRILRALPPCRSRSVLWVVAATGLPPSLIARIQPEHIGQGWLDVVARRKGRGVPPRRIPISRHAQAALRSLARTGAMGWYAEGLRLMFREAKRAAGLGSYDYRAYDLRHTYLTELARRSADEAALSYLAIHARGDMVRRYTGGAVQERAAALVATLVANRPRRRSYIAAPAVAAKRRLPRKPTARSSVSAATSTTAASRPMADD